MAVLSTIGALGTHAFNAGGIYGTLHLVDQPFYESLSRANKSLAISAIAMEKYFQRSNQSLMQLQHTLLSIGGIAAVGLGAALFVFKDFDKQMRDVNSISNLTEKSLKGLSKQVLQLTLEVRQFSPEQMAQGLYQIASSGFYGAKGLKVLEEAAKTAVAGVAGMETTATALTGILQAYNLQAEDARKVSDILFNTVNYGIIRMEELTNGIGGVSAAAANAKIPLEDVSGLIISLTRAGFMPANALVRVERFITAFTMKPDKDLVKLMNSLGVSSGTEMFQKYGIVGAIEKIYNLTKGGKGNLLGDLFGDKREQQAIASLVQDNAKRIKESMELAKKYDGARDRAYNEQRKAFESSANELKATFLLAVTELGEKAVPQALKLFAALKPIVNSLRDINVELVIGGIKWTLIAAGAVTALRVINDIRRSIAGISINVLERLGAAKLAGAGAVTSSGMISNVINTARMSNLTTDIQLQQRMQGATQSQLIAQEQKLAAARTVSLDAEKQKLFIERQRLRQLELATQQLVTQNQLAIRQVQAQLTILQTAKQINGAYIIPGLRGFVSKANYDAQVAAAKVQRDTLVQTSLLLTQQLETEKQILINKIKAYQTEVAKNTTKKESLALALEENIQQLAQLDQGVALLAQERQILQGAIAELEARINTNRALAIQQGLTGELVILQQKLAANTLALNTRMDTIVKGTSQWKNVLGSIASFLGLNWGTAIFAGVALAIWGVVTALNAARKELERLNKEEEAHNDILQHQIDIRDQDKKTLEEYVRKYDEYTETLTKAKKGSVEYVEAFNNIAKVKDGIKDKIKSVTSYVDMQKISFYNLRDAAIETTDAISNSMSKIQRDLAKGQLQVKVNEAITRLPQYFGGAIGGGVTKQAIESLFLKVRNGSLDIDNVPAGLRGLLLDKSVNAYGLQTFAFKPEVEKIKNNPLRFAQYLYAQAKKAGYFKNSNLNSVNSLQNIMTDLDLYAYELDQLGRTVTTSTKTPTTTETGGGGGDTADKATLADIYEAKVSKADSDLQALVNERNRLSELGLFEQASRVQEKIPAAKNRLINLYSDEKAIRSAYSDQSKEEIEAKIAEAKKNITEVETDNDKIFKDEIERQQKEFDIAVKNGEIDRAKRLAGNLIQFIDQAIVNATPTYAGYLREKKADVLKNVEGLKAPTVEISAQLREQSKESRRVERERRRSTIEQNGTPLDLLKFDQEQYIDAMADVRGATNQFDSATKSLSNLKGYDRVKSIIFSNPALWTEDDIKFLETWLNTNATQVEKYFPKYLDFLTNLNSYRQEVIKSQDVVNSTVKSGARNIYEMYDEDKNNAIDVISNLEQFIAGAKQSPYRQTDIDDANKFIQSIRDKEQKKFDKESKEEAKRIEETDAEYNRRLKEQEEEQKNLDEAQRNLQKIRNDALELQIEQNQIGKTLTAKDRRDSAGRKFLSVQQALDYEYNQSTTSPVRKEELKNEYTKALIDYQREILSIDSEVFGSLGETIWNARRDKNVFGNYIKELLESTAKENFSKVWTGIFKSKTEADENGNVKETNPLRRWLDKVTGNDTFKKAYGVLGSAYSGLSAISSIGTESSTGGFIEGGMAGASAGAGIAGALGIAVPQVAIAGALIGAILGTSKARRNAEERAQRIREAQLAELAKINNKLTPQYDFFNRGGFGALTSAFNFAGGMNVEYAWAVDDRRGIR